MLPGVVLLVEEVQYQEKEEEEKLKQDCEVGKHIFKEHTNDDREGTRKNHPLLTVLTRMQKCTLNQHILRDGHTLITTLLSFWLESKYNLLN